jgi:SAM-dependent methyltransferase
MRAAPAPPQLALKRASTVRPNPPWPCQISIDPVLAIVPQALAIKAGAFLLGAHGRAGFEQRDQTQKRKLKPRRTDDKVEKNKNRQMKKEIEDYLKHCKKNTIHEGRLNYQLAKEYISNLPAFYANDIEFRLLFDWHFSPQGKQLQKHETHELFEFQRMLAATLGKHCFNLDYQFWQFYIFHAMVNVKGKSLLEIGGSLPNEMIFDLFGVESYVNTESPDYIEADNDNKYTDRHRKHDRRATIYLNAEDIDQQLAPESFDLIFSVACFEHIYDLEAALQACFSTQKRGGVLYSFFSPIYSYLTDGHHDVIPKHSAFPETPWGLHLLNHSDQRKFLQNANIAGPKEIQEFLGAINFDRIPNRLYYEDYSRILTESPYHVIRLEDAAPDYNISKRHASEVERVRKSNLLVKNLHSQGFRVILQKI